MTSYNKKAKLSASDFPNAEILNLCPGDLPGELWVDVPGLDGIARISNKGRLKRMEREVYNKGFGCNYLLEEKIITLKFHNFFNKHLQEYTCHLIGRICLNDKTHYITISRMVYHCFVEPFDLGDKSVLIVPKDYDGINMDPRNLIKLSYREFQDRVKANQRRDPDFWTKNGHGKPFFSIGQQSHNIEVSQYDLQGHLLATFPSIAVAAKKLNVSQSSISYGLSEDSVTAHGFIWMKGKAPFADLAKFNAALDKRRGPSVSQYDLNGMLLRTFLYMDEAAAFVGRCKGAIQVSCRKKSRICANYLWRYYEVDQLNEDEVREAMKTSRWQTVSCYNTDGFKIATYQGIREASIITGLNPYKITTHTRRSDLLLNGMVWRMGDEPIINKADLQDAIEYVNKNWPPEVTQYSISGKRIAVHPSVDSAAEDLGIEAKKIHSSARGHSFLAGGFIWQRGAGKELLMIL